MKAGVDTRHTVAITGARGFIGRRLRRAFEETETTIVEWDLPEQDLTDRPKVGEVFADCRPRIIYHLAADGVDSQRAHDVGVVDANVRMVANLIENADRGTVLVIAGSMSEYGVAGVVGEETACAPTTAYGIGKLAATNYAMVYGPEKGIVVRVARIFGVYGPGENEKRLFPTLIEKLEKGVVVPLSDGMQRRDFIYVDDVCSGLVRLAALNESKPILVNLGTGCSVRVKDVASWIAESLGADGGLLGFGMRARSPGDMEEITADVSRLRAVLGWVPEQRIRRGMDVRQLFDLAK